MNRFGSTILLVLIILSIVLAGCIVPGNSSSANPTTKPTANNLNPASKPTTNSNINPTKINELPRPNFQTGQIALVSAGSKNGLAIIGFNNITRKYSTLEVIADSKVGSYHTDGFQLIKWKNQDSVDQQYKSFLSARFDPEQLPMFDVTISANRNNYPLHTPDNCYIAGDWRVNNGASTYKFRLDNIVVNQTGNQILIGTWQPVETIAGKSYKIQWNFTPPSERDALMEKITLSGEDAFNGETNYGGTTNGKWIGLIPSWKANPKLPQDCVYRWSAIDPDWYKKLT